MKIDPIRLTISIIVMVAIFASAYVRGIPWGYCVLAGYGAAVIIQNIITGIASGLRHK